MSTQTRIRRDTAANLATSTPAEAEMGYDQTNKRMLIGDGLRQGGFAIPTFHDIQRQNFGYAVAGGTPDALTIALNPALLSYANGVSFEFRANGTNTGAVTIDVNGLGTQSVQKRVNGALVNVEAGDIVSGLIYKVTYDGTQFQLQYYQQSIVPPGLVFLGTLNAAPFNFVSLIDSTYDTYMIDFDLNGSVPNPAIQFSINNGSSYISTGYNNNGAANQSQINIAPQGIRFAGQLFMYGLNDTGGNRKIIKSSIVAVNQIPNFYGNLQTDVSAVNAVRIINASSGRATLYGYSK